MIIPTQSARTVSESDVVRELMREHSDPAWGSVYRVGVVYSAVRLVLSLVNVFQKDPMADVAMADPVAFSCFPNEYAALEIHARNVGRLYVIHLNGPRLGFITRTKGIRWVLSNLARGASALRMWNTSPSGRSLAIPLLGWLLYRYVLDSEHWRASSGKFVITNIIHPLSLGAMFGFAHKGSHVTYVEHAMTPRNMMRPLPIDEVYFSSPHTLELWRTLLPESGAELRQRFSTPVPRAEKYRLPVNPQILICINDLDALSSVESIVRASRTASSNVAIRLHEADPRRAAVAAVARRAGARMSFARESPIATDLQMADVVICGNTNALLDALRARKRIVYYWDGDKGMFDYYGSVAFYDVESAKSEIELVRRLTVAMGR